MLEEPQKTLFESLRDRLLSQHGAVLRGMFGRRDGASFLVVLDLEQIWPDDETREVDRRQILQGKARTLIEPAERKLKAARLLAGGGLLEEARPSAVEAMMCATRTLAVLDDAAEPEDADGLDSSRLAMEMLGGAELDDESLVAVSTFVDNVTGMVGQVP